MTDKPVSREELYRDEEDRPLPRDGAIARCPAGANRGICEWEG